MKTPIFLPGDKVFFYGDSLTKRTSIQNTNSKNYVDFFISKISIEIPSHGITFYNKGESGNTILDLTKRFSYDIKLYRPDWVIILIGVNDAKNNNTPKNFAFNLNILIELIILHNIKPIIFSTVPCLKNIHINNLLNLYSIEIRKLTITHKLLFVELNEVFYYNRKKNKINKNYFIDHTHLSNEGNISIANKLYRTILQDQEELMVFYE